jgi:hypothetical protein
MNDSQHNRKHIDPEQGGGTPATPGASQPGAAATPPPGPSAGAFTGGGAPGPDPQGAGPAYQAPASGHQGAPSGATYQAGQWQAPPVSTQDPRRKSPGMAAILALAPGLGHVYLGYYSRGFLNAVVVASIISLLAAVRLPEVMYPLLGMFLPFFWLYNIVDAGRRAAYMNLILDGGRVEEIPQEFAMPEKGGSLGGGIALVVVGMILLAHTLLDISLEWLEYWWPLGIVLVGVWLLARSLKERVTGS